MFTVCPGFMFVGLIWVFAPFTSAKVKKLFVDMLTEAVVEEIVKADTWPRNDPVRVTCWFNGFTNEEVNAKDALVTVPATKEAVAAYEAVAALICKPFI
jgi:hypothetical protein